MDTWTVKRLLEWTTDFFKGKGIESPRLEAEILLSTAIGVKRIELYTNFESEPNEAQRTRFREFVKRRGAGEPVAYLVGFKEFFSISLKVDRNVLIPRPETERLVLETLDILKTFPPDATPKICDVGTGSGAIAIALAKNWPKTLGTVSGASKIVAVDIEQKAIFVAQENAVKNGVANRIEFAVSDLLHEIEGSFDVIVSNPPYVSATEYENLPVDVKNYEPKTALLAGPSGTEIIEKLIGQATKKLASGGWFLVEGSPMIVDNVAALLDDWTDVRIVDDDMGKPRFVIGRRNNV